MYRAIERDENGRVWGVAQVDENGNVVSLTSFTYGSKAEAVERAGLLSQRARGIPKSARISKELASCVRFARKRGHINHGAALELLSFLEESS
tara:strand:- start:9698 stop:9976 length:279 start_codon:yes stop_codon:yes gene_type:complete